jgi:hypothetical protein
MADCDTASRTRTLVCYWKIIIHPRVPAKSPKFIRKRKISTGIQALIPASIGFHGHLFHFVMSAK